MKANKIEKKCVILISETYNEPMVNYCKTNFNEIAFCKL